MLKRSAFKTQRGPQPAKPDRSAEFASFLMPASVNAVMARADAPGRALVALAPRIVSRKRPAICDSANGEDCTVRIVGACNSDPTTTVWSHLPGLDGDRGMGIKALDICGAYCCWSCHEVVDARAPLPAGATRQSVMLDWHAGHMRSLVRLAQKGLV